MTKLQNGNMSFAGKIFAVITCALMTGFMWRVRGDHGWGSMWGMFAVGVMLILFIYAVFGERKKMNYEMLPLAVFFLGITNGGWGTPFLPAETEVTLEAGVQRLIFYMHEGKHNLWDITFEYAE